LRTQEQKARDRKEWFDDPVFIHGDLEGTHGGQRIQDDGHYHALATWLNAEFPEKPPLVDIGCGVGFLLRNLRNLGWMNLHGFDLSAEAVRCQVANGLVQECSVLDILDEYPALAGTAGVVLSWNAIGYLWPDQVPEALSVFRKLGASDCAHVISVTTAELWTGTPGRRCVRPFAWWDRTFRACGFEFDPSRHARWREQTGWLSYVLRAG